MNKAVFLRRILACCLVIGVLILAHIQFGITCPIRYLFKLPCPTCGMTRAWLSVLHMDFNRAFYYHPLFITAPIIICYVCLYDSHYRTKIFDRIIYIILIAFVFVYIIRLSTGSIA